MGTASLTINVCRVAVVAVVAVLGGCQEGRAPLAPLGTPVLAHNSDRNEYLVVWWGEDPGAGVVDEEFEVFGQRLSAAGEETGADDFRISIMGAAGDPAYAALVPAVAAGDGEYLVAWWGDTGEPPLEDNEAEVYVRPIPAGGLGEPRRGLRVSRMGPDGEYLFAAVDPAVAFNTRDEEYVVVWLADEPGPPLADNDFELFLRRLGRPGG